MKDQKYIQQALLQARKAFSRHEVPIGAVLVDQNGKVVARGYNQVESKKTQLAHAELSVIDKATKKLGDWRLDGMTLYVTVQPCIMCFGALYVSRVSRVVYGAISPLFGMQLDKGAEFGIYKHLSTIVEHIDTPEAGELMRLFFRSKRRLKYDQKSGHRKN